MYKLFTDVMSDLPLDYVTAHGLEVIPLSVSLDGEEYTLAADPSAPGCASTPRCFISACAPAPAPNPRRQTPSRSLR